MINNTGEEGWRSPFLQEYCPVFPNVEDGVFLDNIRRSVERDLPWLQQHAPHDGVAVIVGGGPSLADHVERVRQHGLAGHDIVAVNNTARYLIDRSVRPNKHVILDARASNARFVVGGPECYLASQCAEETFEAVSGNKVTLWHPYVDGVKEIIGERKTALIGGGTTVGLQAIAIMYALGYRSFHLYGFDSSYRDAAGHAYPQSENDNDEVSDFVLNGRHFYAARWMAHQADEFKNIVQQMTDCEIAVYGDGLLPYMMQLMVNPPDEGHAVYDLSLSPASHDFITWLVAREMFRKQAGVEGPLRISFIAGPDEGFRKEIARSAPGWRQMFFENVMKPAMTMLGAIEVPLADTAYRENQYTMRPVVDMFNHGAKVPTFTPSNEAFAEVDRFLKGKKPVVITLREATHWPQRNSNFENWRRFADDLYAAGETVVFVRDTEKADEPICGHRTFPLASRDVQVRTALYQRAKFNFFTSNGPTTFAQFSSAPFAVFEPLVVPGFPVANDDWWLAFMGIARGTQYPWFRTDQRIIWADDSFENIEAAWAAFAIPQTEK